MRNFNRLEDLFLLFLFSLPLLPLLLMAWFFAWSWYESTYAPAVALRALNTFVAPCHAPGMELDCQTGRTVPTGPYQIVVAELGPFSGVFVTVRSADGLLVDMDVFPALFGRHLVQIESIGRAD